MSKEKPQPEQSEEVDLGQLFKLIGNAFDRFFKFIASIFIGVYKLVLVLLIHFYKRVVWYAAAVIIGVVVGFIIDMNLDKLYGANMFIETNFNSSRQVYENIKQFHQLAYEDKDSLELAGRILENPLPENDAITKEGEVLYTKYCTHCHGENGGGSMDETAKVGQVYQGVPAYNTGRVATVSGGHIFHVITHGKGRMGAHGSQVQQEDRWKIVRYVMKEKIWHATQKTLAQ